jgi:hypothetical protein
LPNPTEIEEEKQMRNLLLLFLPVTISCSSVASVAPQWKLSEVSEQVLLQELDSALAHLRAPSNFPPFPALALGVLVAARTVVSSLHGAGSITVTRGSEVVTLNAIAYKTDISASACANLPRSPGESAGTCFNYAQLMAWRFGPDGGEVLVITGPPGLAPLNPQFGTVNTSQLYRVRLRGTHAEHAHVGQVAIGLARVADDCPPLELSKIQFACEKAVFSIAAQGQLSIEGTDTNTDLIRLTVVALPGAIATLR